MDLLHTHVSFMDCRCCYLLCMIITALWDMFFLGTNEFWGATVITNLFSAIPFFGNELLLGCGEGFLIDNATLLAFIVTLFYAFIISALLVFIYFITSN